MKYLLCSILLFFSFISYSKQPQDYFVQNTQVQDLVKKYNAVLLSDSNTYFKDLVYDVAFSDGNIYSISSKVSYDFVRDLQKIQNGFYAFKIEQNFGIENTSDKVAIIRNIIDQIDLLHYMKIQGNDFEVSNQDIIKWFCKWEKEFTFRIIGVGIDFIQADIITEPKDYKKLTKEIYAICPDDLGEGPDSTKERIKEMKSSKTLYLWWD